jgi:hypothetical protein
MFRSGVQTEPIGDDWCHKGEKDHPIVDHCGYFVAQLHASVSVLSSSVIQEDYFRAVKRRKKKQDSELKYLLIAFDNILKSKDDSSL